MKRTDDVFFFVLIDFLLQAFFFGLLLYVLAQTVQAEKDAKYQALENQTRRQEEQVKASGFSNLTQLLDFLTNLVPASELKGVADFFSNSGGYSKVKESVEVIKQAGGVDQVAPLVDLVQEAGGPEKVREGVELLRKAGLGKPSCNNENGRPKAAATVIASDITIRFESNTPELSQALSLLGLSYEDVSELTLADFKQKFTPLRAMQPDCRYTLRFVETTRYVDARDAARFTFYLNIVKR